MVRVVVSAALEPADPILARWVSRRVGEDALFTGRHFVAGRSRPDVAFAALGSKVGSFVAPNPWPGAGGSERSRER